MFVINKMYGGLQNVSFGLNLSSTNDNETVKVATTKLRSNINSFD
jgi:hypothetical protein